MTAALQITRIQPQDFDDFISLIRALADFEKLDPPSPDAVERLKRDAFSDRPKYEAFLARTEDGRAVAYCIIFETYSSFLARPTLYLEDIFVVPDARRQGVGRACFDFLVSLARERECGRIEWQVLDWNTPAITFYDALGATHMKEWYSYRLRAEQFDTITPPTKR